MVTRYLGTRAPGRGNTDYDLRSNVESIPMIPDLNIVAVKLYLHTRLSEVDRVELHSLSVAFASVDVSVKGSKRSILRAWRFRRLG